MPAALFMRFFLLLALLFAPVSMAGTHAVMAMPAHAAATAGHEIAPAPGHCADMAAASKEAPSNDLAPAKDIDCTIACSCMPPAVGGFAERVSFVARVNRPEATPLLAGLSLEAEPRPPKVA